MYSFDVDVACIIGVDEAIMLQHLSYWVRYNQNNNTNFHEGRYWTYNTNEAFSKWFKFWSERQIRHILQKLKNDGYIMTGCFNSRPFDRTKWYALTPKGEELMNGRVIEVTKTADSNCQKAEYGSDKNGSMDLTNMSNGTDKNVRPIPNNKPNSKPNNKNINILSCKHDDAPVEVVEADIVESAAKPKQASVVGQVEEIVDYLNAKLGTSYKATTKDTVSRIKARLKEGFTVSDFKTVIDKKADEWSGDEKMVKYLRPSTLFGSNFESYLNQMDVDYSKATPTVSERDKRERANTMQLLKEAREYDSRNGNTVSSDITGKLPW